MALGIKQYNPLLVIINPVAGGGRARKAWSHLRPFLLRDGIEHHSICTRAPGHASELALTARGRGYGALIVLGGDGTVSEIAQGLVESPLPMAIIPAGRGNDLGKVLGLPSSLEACWAQVATGQMSAIDVGIMGQRPFVNIVGAGLDAETAAMANRFPRFLGGLVPYLVSLAINLAVYRNSYLRVETDNGSWEGKASLMAVGIGSHYGGGFNILPGADPADGLLEVCVAGNLSKLSVARMVPAVLKGTHTQHPAFYTWRATSVKVQADRPVAIQADGEVVGHLPAAFGILPGALKVLGLRGVVSDAVQGQASGG